MTGPPPTAPLENHVIPPPLPPPPKKNTRDIVAQLAVAPIENLGGMGSNSVEVIFFGFFSATD